MQADQSGITWWNERVLPHLIGEARADQSRAGELPKEFIFLLADAISRLSKAYIERAHHSTLPDPIRKESDALAYATYFGVINFAKFDLLLSQLPSLTDRPLAVLDFGCGPGTASLAALRILPTLSSIALVDHSPSMLSVAERLLRNTNDRSTLKITAGSRISSPPESFDLILAGNVLCELPSTHRLANARTLFDLLRPGGYLTLLEPGQPDPTRTLMEPQAVPVFPCTHPAPCPMLRDSASDWCHTELGWERPQLVTQLDQALGFNKHRLKFSALVIGKGGLTAVPQGFRIVAPPRRDPRGVVLPVCGPGYFGPILIGKKASPDCRVMARRSRWFDRIAIEPQPSQSSQQVTEIRPGL
jgi:ribosomal protein RSM22 (predicted rRNA methylase)